MMQKSSVYYQDILNELKIIDTSVVKWHSIHNKTAKILIWKSLRANFLMQFIKKIRNLAFQTSSAFFLKIFIFFGTFCSPTAIHPVKISEIFYFQCCKNSSVKIQYSYPVWLSKINLTKHHFRINEGRFNMKWDQLRWFQQWEDRNHFHSCQKPGQWNIAKLVNFSRPHQSKV